jgi:iron(III) transport system permease protein
MARRPSATSARLGVTGLMLAVLVAYPLVRLFSELGGSSVSFATTWPVLVAPLTNTVVTSVVAAVLAVAAGAAGALVAERSGSAAVHIGMLFPLLVPPFVSAVAWLRAFGPSGLIDDLVGISWAGVEGAVGVTVLIAVNAAPIAYLVIRAGLRTRIRPGLLDAARSVGAQPWTVFTTVTLPIIRPSLVGAFGLSFVFGANAFGIPAVLGVPAGFGTMTTSIFQDLVRSARPEAFERVILSGAILVVLAVAVVALTDPVGVWRGGAVGNGTPQPRGLSKGVAAVFWGLVGITSGIPLIALLLTALTKAPGLNPVPANWTTANFDVALAGAGGSAVVRSVWLAASAALLVVVLSGLSASIGSARGGRVLGRTTVLSFAVPGSALAVAILLAYGLPLADGLPLIFVAYTAKFWALGHRTVEGSVAGASQSAMIAARVSGADWMTALRTVLLPLLSPVLVSAWLIVFLFGFHELTMSSLLYDAGSETLAVVILNLQQLGDAGATAALAVILTALVLSLGGVGYGLRSRWQR